MQEIFEKIIEKFTNIRRVVKNDEDLEWNRAEYKCKQIVEQAIAEYNNGWIPCSERFPEKTNHYLVTTDNHTISMYAWWKISEKRWFYFNSTVEMFDVIAWQPLPEPYQPKGE